MIFYQLKLTFLHYYDADALHICIACFNIMKVFIGNVLNGLLKGGNREWEWRVQGCDDYVRGRCVTY